MAAKFGHQAAARAVPEPPADELLHRRPRRAVGQRHLRVAMLRSLDRRVGDLGLELGDLLLQRIDVGRLGGGEILLPARELLGQRRVVGHGRLPGVVAREVTPVPLGTDRVQIAEQFRLADRVHGVVVEDAVMPLVSGGQDLARLAGHAAHLLALMDAVAHELLGEHVLAGPHRLDGRFGMEVEGQGDDHRLDVLVGEQFLVAAVDLHLPAGFVLRGPLVLGHEAGASRRGAGARRIAMEGAEHVVGADIGDRDDVEIVGVMSTEQHAPLVARAEHAHPERVAHALAVAEVDRPEAGTGRESRCDGAAEKISPRDVHGVGEVFLADRLLLLGQVHRVTSFGVGQPPAHQRQSGHHCFRKYSRPLQPPIGRAAIASRAASSTH